MTMLIDVNCWTGHWPFQELLPREPADLARHLRAEKIDRALVSSCESVFYPDPHPANEELFRRLEDLPMLLPVPVLNPALGNWKDLLDRYRRLGVRALALLPSYHGYSLNGSTMALFMGAWRQNASPPLMIYMRLEDERSHHPLCKVPPVEADHLVQFARRFAEHTFVICCCYFREARVLLPQAENVLLDVSFVEKFKSMASLMELADAGRLLFGSHTPFIYTRSSLMKVHSPHVPERERNRITYANAIGVFGLEEGDTP
jgi:predicted TIM-barrel fold metal-dependent hydrolase